MSRVDSDTHMIPIHRFKFTHDITEALHGFAKVHQYDDRKVYKEAWEKWCEINHDFIQREIVRLQNLDYKGDILDKMFKSARYYYRKKNVNKEEKSEKDENAKRRQYISMDEDILVGMDIHIEKNIQNNEYSPANGYNDFCTSNINLLKKEINRLYNGNYDINAKDITHKIKKTYKNRYYQYKRNMDNTV